MAAVTKFELVKDGAGGAPWRRIAAFLRHCGAVLLKGMHEARRREAADIIAHGRYLAGLGGAARLNAARLDAGRLDERPRVVRLRRAPATQPSSEPPDAPLDGPQGEAV